PLPLDLTFFPADCILLIAGISLMIPDVVFPGIASFLHTTMTTIVKALNIGFIVSLATQSTIRRFTGCHEQKTEYDRNTKTSLKHMRIHLLIRLGA
ncbi:hypothetical protein DRQ32_10655, partial [bacterium]